MNADYLRWAQYVPDLLPGLWVSLKLTAIVLGLGYPLGLLLATTTASKNLALKIPSLVVVEVGRGMPLLVLLYIVYQGLPQVDLTPTAMISAIVAFTWSAGAYSAEIIRASLGAVPTGQAEASTALGLNGRDAFRFVTAPQGIRVAIPPLMNLAIQFFQFTSLAYVVTVPEIMQAAYFRATVTFDYFSVFIAAGFLYAVVTIPCAALVSRLERRMAVHL